MGSTPDAALVSDLGGAPLFALTQLLMDPGLEANLCSVADRVEGHWVTLRQALHKGEVKTARDIANSLAGHLSSANWYVEFGNDDEVQEWFRTRFRNL
jgi:hypothetical protein